MPPWQNSQKNASNGNRVANGRRRVKPEARRCGVSHMLRGCSDFRLTPNSQTCLVDFEPAVAIGWYQTSDGSAAESQCS